MSSRFMNWPVASAPGSQYHHEASWNILKLMRSQLVKPQNPGFFWSPTRDQAQWLMLSLKLMQKKKTCNPASSGECVYIYTYNYIYNYTYIYITMCIYIYTYVCVCVSSSHAFQHGPNPVFPAASDLQKVHILRLLVLLRTSTVP